MSLCIFNKMMEVVKSAADELAKEGISAEVIDLHYKTFRLSNTYHISQKRQIVWS